jgi:hypothetical protein
MNILWSLDVKNQEAFYREAVTLFLWGWKFTSHTLQCYREMINEFLAPKLPPNHNVWFQQNGATSHTAVIRMAAPHLLFPQRMTSRLSDVPWPPCSPDLTAPDFFLWDYLKIKVCSRRPLDLNALQQTIETKLPTFQKKHFDKLFAASQTVCTCAFTRVLAM